MVTINLTLVIQIVSIVAAVFGIVFSCMSFSSSTLSIKVISAFILFLSLMLLFVEIYIIPFFRFFGFLLKPWGKACTYLFVGFFLYKRPSYGSFAGVLYWTLAVIYFFISFLTNGIARPLLQQTGDIQLTTGANDYFVV